MFDFLRGKKRRLRSSKFERANLDALTAQSEAYKMAIAAQRVTIAHYRKALDVQEDLTNDGYDLDVPEQQPRNLVDGLGQIIAGSDLNQGIKTGVISMINSNPTEINHILNQFMETQFTKLNKGKEKDVLNA